MPPPFLWPFGGAAGTSFYDTAPLKATLEVLGPDNLLLGTDYGHNTDTSAEMLAHNLIRKHPDLDAVGARKIVSDNAVRFYGL